MKKFVKNILAKFGYEVVLLQGFYPPYLADICQPKTVIDVGVGYGTYPLYRAFPQAKFILVEPLIEYKNTIDKIAKKYNCEIIYQAIGNTPRQQEIIIDVRHLQLSSFSRRRPSKAIGTPSPQMLERRLIDVTTLDKILSDRENMEKQILLKLDTEGHELEALQGGKQLLQATDTVIAEVSVAQRFEESYEFEDLIFFMKEHGFYVLAFLNVTHVRGEGRPRFVDIVFKRRN